MADLTSILNPMAGFLSSDEQSAVQGNSMLQLAGGLLAGSGWQPHPVSFGSVFGQAGLPALQAQQQMTGQMLQMKHLKNQIDLENMMMPFKQSAIQELMGTPQQAPVPTATDVQGNQFPVNQLPPYLSNNPNAAAQASQTIQNQQNAVPMQTPGMPGVGYFNPQEMYRRGQAYMMLGMPGGADLMNAALAHDPNLAAATEEAKARATLPYTALNNFLRYAGRPTVANPGQDVYSGLQLLPPWAQNLIGGAGGQMPSNASQPTPGMSLQPAYPPTQSPQSPTYPQPPSSGRPQPIARGMSLGDAEYQKEAGKAGVEYENQINTEAKSSIEQNRMLDTLNNAMKEFTPGKAAAFRKAVAEWKVQMGIASPDEQKIAASGEEGDKLTGQLAAKALRTVFQRPTQAEFEIFRTQFVPNNMLTLQGAQRIMGFMRQQNNLGLQKQQAFKTWKQGQSPTAYRDFEIPWNQQMAASPLSAEHSFGAPVQAPATTGLSPAGQAAFEKYRPQR